MEVGARVSTGAEGAGGRGPRHQGGSKRQGATGARATSGRKGGGGGQCGTLEKFGSFSHTHTHTCALPPVNFPTRYRRRNENASSKPTCARLFGAALIRIDQKWKQPKCPFGEWTHVPRCIHAMGAPPTQGAGVSDGDTDSREGPQKHDDARGETERPPTEWLHDRTPRSRRRGGGAGGAAWGSSLRATG